MEYLDVEEGFKKQKVLFSGNFLLPKDVIEHAENLSATIKGTNRSEVRLERKYACLYYAIKHLNLSNEYPPNEIAKLVNLDPKKIMSAVTRFSSLDKMKKKSPERDDMLPYRGYINNCCEKLNLTEEFVDETIEILRYVLSKTNELNSKNPETVSISVVKFTCLLNNLLCCTKEISGISDTTINTTQKIISKIYNSCQ
jgi:transcription initiation factor TFIIIB Brf1 subunit/transcription initiation factor TFIIB